MRIHPRPPRMCGFTLLEVVISIAVLAIGFTSIILSLGYASSLSAKSVGSGHAIGILRNAFADMKIAQAGGFQKSPQYALDPASNNGSPRVLWFDEDGQQVQTQRDASYRCVITSHPDPAHPDLLHLHGRVAWPAKAVEGREANQMELLTSLRIQ